MTYRKASFDEKFYNKSPTITSFLRASEPSCFGPPQAQAHTMPVQPCLRPLFFRGFYRNFSTQI